MLLCTDQKINLHQTEILLHSGEYFNLANPERSALQMHQEDIALALSKICRFTGQSSEFYSVAQHAYLVSYLVPQQFAMEALTHDDHECVLNDISTPLKTLLPDYCALEKRFASAFRSRLGLNGTESACVRQADLIMLATERRDLLPARKDDYLHWHCLDNILPLEEILRPMSSVVAYEMYMQRFDELMFEAVRKACALVADM